MRPGCRRPSRRKKGSRLPRSDFSNACPERVEIENQAVGKEKTGDAVFGQQRLVPLPPAALRRDRSRGLVSLTRTFSNLSSSELIAMTQTPKLVSATIPCVIIPSPEQPLKGAPDIVSLIVRMSTCWLYPTVAKTKTKSGLVMALHAPEPSGLPLSRLLPGSCAHCILLPPTFP